MIRQAVGADIPRLGELLEEIYQLHAQLRPDFLRPDGSRKYSDEDLEQLLTESDKPIFVYEDESQQVQAYLFCQLQESKGHATLTDRRVLYIDDLCVAEEVRGQGIGEALMDFAQDLARQKGCSKLTLTV